MLSDPHNLQRFLDAQSGIYLQARAELAAGQKRSHWMWFVFPQIQGLGSSPIARRYAIASLAEAAAYLAHPVVGSRLREVTGLVNNLEHRSIEDIFGYPDNLKFHSSVTLFAQIDTAHPQDPQDTQDPQYPKNIFARALSVHFSGQPDQATLNLLDLQ